MKTIMRYAPFGALLACAPLAHACDLCAVYTAGMAHGETTGWYAGASTQFTRYDELRMDGHRVHADSGQYLDSSITQLFVGYGITNRLGVQVTLPYIHRSFERPVHDGVDKDTLSGIGDATAIAQYVLFRHDDADHSFVWRALGGIKFGTGDSDRLREELDEDHHHDAQGQVPVARHGGHGEGPVSGIHGHDLALGSGSTDFVVGTSAFARTGRWFGSGDVQYAIRRRGDFDYRFGNDLQWTLSAGRYLVLEHGRTVSLQLNLAGEDKDYDDVAGMKADDTHARMLFLGPQLGFTFGPRWSLELRAETPVDVDNSAIQTTAGWRARAALVAAF